MSVNMYICFLVNIKLDWLVSRRLMEMVKVLRIWAEVLDGLRSCAGTQRIHEHGCSHGSGALCVCFHWWTSILTSRRKATGFPYLY